MEDFSFSLNEAKPKHFGLEMFAVMLLASWNLPCLLPRSFPVGLLPTRTAFPVKHPRDSESKSCNTSGNLDLPGLFVIFVLKCPNVFWKVWGESCAPVDSWQRFSFIWWGRGLCYVASRLGHSCGQGCLCVCGARSFPTPTGCCGAVQQWILSLCYDTLKSWAHLKCPQPCSVQDFKLV